MTPHPLRAFTLLWLTCLNIGCVAWRPVALPGPEDSTWVLRHDLRVTDQGGRKTEGIQAERRGEQLLVTHREGYTVPIPLSDVTRVDRKGISVLRTIGAVYLVVGAIGAMIIIANPPDLFSGWESTP